MGLGGGWGVEQTKGEEWWGREYSSTMIHHHSTQHTPLLCNMPAPTPCQQFGSVPKSDKVTLALFSCAAAPRHSNQTVSSTSASQQNTGH